MMMMLILIQMGHSFFSCSTIRRLSPHCLTTMAHPVASNDHQSFVRQPSTGSSSAFVQHCEPDPATMERFRQTFSILIDSIGIDPGGEYLRTFLRDISRSNELGRVFPLTTWENVKLFSLLTQNWINEFYPIEADKNTVIINQVKALIGKPIRSNFEYNLTAIQAQHWHYFRPVLKQATLDPHMEYNVFLAELLSGYAVLQHLEEHQERELLKYRMTVGITWYVLPRIAAEQDLTARLLSLLERMVAAIQADQGRANVLLFNSMMRAMVKADNSFRDQILFRPKVVFNGTLVYFTSRVPVIRFFSSVQMLFCRNGKSSYRPVIAEKLIIAALTNNSLPFIPIEHMRAFQQQFNHELRPIAYHFGIDLNIGYHEAIQYLSGRLQEIDFDTEYQPLELKSMAIMATIVLPALAAQLKHRRLSKSINPFSHCI